MGDRTGIEWSDSTWSPIRARNVTDGKIGWHCEHVSEGCRFCYAETLNGRLGTGALFRPDLINNGQIEVFLDEKMLRVPLHWKKPRRIFVNSMTDTFARFVPDAWIDRIFAVMALCPQHTFQVLTKRPERMQKYLGGPFSGDGVAARIADATWAFAEHRNQLPQTEPPPVLEVPVGPRLPSGEPEFGFRRMLAVKYWPLPHVWLGVSVENQATADERVPLLLQTPAAVRFLSCEPLLGPVGLDAIQAPRYVPEDHEVDWKFSCLITGDYYWIDCDDRPSESGDGPYRKHCVDWVIVGGESGHDARPMNEWWALDLVQQCRRASVPVFVKQLSSGGPKPIKDMALFPEALRVREFPGAATKAALSMQEGFL